MTEIEPVAKSGPSRSLWVGVSVVFGLMALAWTVLFILTSRNPVETVPLEHRAP